jgi:hypothetical protein
MHGDEAIAVTKPMDPSEVPPDWQTNRDVLVLVLQIILEERYALIGQEALGYASIWMCPIANVAFENVVQPFEQHHVVEEWQLEVDDIIHHMDEQMHHDVVERGVGREVNLKLA